MSQPESRGSWSVDDQPHHAPNLVSEQGTSQLPLASVDYETLLKELAQARSLDDERVARIYHLEQALDQALLCLGELRVQVRDQQILETQLATTEEFAGIQQRAIARLKRQLDSQHRLIETELTPVASESLLQELIATLRETAQVQQVELDRLQAHQDGRQTKIAAHCQRLEQQIRELQVSLESRQRRILGLEAEALAAHAQAVRLQSQLGMTQQQVRQLQIVRHESLRSAESVAESSQPPDALTQMSLTFAEPPEGGDPPPAKPPLEPAMPLKQELSKMQIRIEELELQLSRQMAAQARWQHRCQELEADCNRYQARSSEIDRQVTEMQEQILKQTRQAGEYEAAIQHWKDRYASGQRQMSQLKELLERVLPLPASDADPNADFNPALAELLAAIHAALTLESDDPLAVPSPHFNTLDLPDFLIRRRNYRKIR